MKQETKKNKPVAVVISDVHYNIQTLEVADKAMNLAIDKAYELNVDLIVCGDLHDTKANLRGECVARMLKTFTRLRTHCYILRGNHDQINEKSEEHSLEFLRYVAGVLIVDNPIMQPIGYFIPYQHDPLEFSLALAYVPKGSIIFCHQGVIGSNSGHYIQDKSAVPLEWLKYYRVISGHYHTRQTIYCNDPEPSYETHIGQFDYVGNPYTLGFGEANDPEKGFQILYDDGNLEFVPTNLRRHRTLELDYWMATTPGTPILHPTDILWVKVTGPSDKVCNITHKSVAKVCNITQNFKLDLIPLDTKSIVKTDNDAEMSQPELLDTLIDGLTNTDNTRKIRLKELWKRLI